MLYDNALLSRVYLYAYQPAANLFSATGEDSNPTSSAKAPIALGTAAKIG